MDRFIAAYPAIEDGDLMLCAEHGVAWQKDRAHVISYDDDYYAKCRSYEDQAIAVAINAGRIELVARHYSGRLLDVGIGSGEFVRKRPNTFGLDVNPVAIEWLKRNDRWSERLGGFGAVSFWDVLEHVETPEAYLRQVNLHAYLFTCLPIMYSLGGIRLSKHYRPGEHLFYWTEDGFVQWMGRHGFMLLESASFEIDAGRESIYSFAFKRIRWPVEYERGRLAA